MRLILILITTLSRVLIPTIYRWEDWVTERYWVAKSINGVEMLTIGFQIPSHHHYTTLSHKSGSRQTTQAWAMSPEQHAHLSKESLPASSSDQQPLPQKGHKLLMYEFPALHLVRAFAIHPTEQVCLSGFCKKSTLKVTYHRHFWPAQVPIYGIIATSRKPTSKMRIHQK